MGTFRTLAPHLERVLIRVPGVHCAKLGAVSIQIPGTGVDRVARQLGGLIEPVFALIDADLSMAGPVAQSARIAP
jgi:hypothetical protein